MGFNESDPLSLCDPKLLHSLDLFYRDDECIPLKNGKIRLTERLSTDEKTMPTDWIPDDPLPPRKIPIKIEVENETGEAVRGWAKERQTLQMCGVSVTGERPFFVIKTGEGTLVAAGTDLEIRAKQDLDLKLVDYTVAGETLPLACDAHLRTTSFLGGVTVHQDGWHSLHWVQITVK